MVEACRVDGTREAGRREPKERDDSGGVCESDLRQVTAGDVLTRTSGKPYCQVGFRCEESKMTP